MGINRRLFILWLIYLLFVIYGSLVPIDYHPLPLQQAWNTFKNIPYLSIGIDSRADWVANILLFIPLSFFWLCFLDPRTIVTKILTSLLILLSCIALSIGIEFTQLFFPPRTVSQNDIIAESIGAAVGMVVWWWKGRYLSEWISSWWSTNFSGVAINILWFYLFILFGYNVLPLDLTISPIEIYHKWHEGKLTFIPFTHHYQSIAQKFYNITIDIIIWIPVSLLWIVSGKKNPFQSWVWTSLAAAIVEFIQLFIYSRFSDTTQVIAAMIGAAIGVWLARLIKFNQYSTPNTYSFNYSWIGLIFFLFWSVVLMAIFWYPYNFNFEQNFILMRLNTIYSMPLMGYYYQTEYRAITALFRRIFLFMPLGFGFAFYRIILYGLSPKKFLTNAIIFLLGLIPFIIEIGLVALPLKLPDYGDIIFAWLGGILGYCGFLTVYRIKIFSAANNRNLIPKFTVTSPSYPAMQGSTYYRTAQPAPSDSSAQAHGYSWKKIILIYFIMMSVFALACEFISRSSGLPYNVKELFVSDLPFITAIQFFCFLLWVFGIPVVISWWLQRGHWLRSFIYPLLIVFHGIVGWFIIKLTVPQESIDDIVGSMLMNWPWQWEMMGRFIALFMVPTVLLCGTASLILDRLYKRHFFEFTLKRWFLPAALLLLTSYWIVIRHASTDNLTELMADGASFTSSILIAIWILFNESIASIITSRLAAYKFHFLYSIAIVMSYLLIGYWLISKATEPFILKYDKVYSTLQFILCPDRDHLVYGAELFIRYSVFYFTIILLLSIAQFPFWCWIIQKHRLSLANT